MISNSSTTFYFGGGIYNDLGNLTINNSNISNNTAQFCGGIYNAGTVTLIGSTLTANMAMQNYGYGGGICNNGTAAINNSTISGNSANYSGGGIYIESSAVTTINNSTIISNTTGGNNTGVGGGIYTYNSTVSINNSIVSGNTSPQGFAGGIYKNNGSLTMTDSTISGNSANYDGGGIYNYGGTIAITNSTISGNVAMTQYGGGIMNEGGGVLTLTNSTVSGNTSGSRFSTGGGIKNSGAGTLNLNNVTVTNNKSSNASCTNCAGGVWNESDSTMNLLNTIIAGNTVANAAGSPDFYGAVSSTSSFNIIGNNQGTTGITNGTNNNQVGTNTSPIDARFAPLGNYGGTTQTHTLFSDSPAIDAGSDCVINLTCSSNNPPAALTTDQRGTGFPRKVGSAVDIGAVEVIPSYTVSTPVGQNISIAPTSNLNLNFSNVTTAGNTVATVIPPDQLQPLPSEFTLFGSNLTYDITTSAVFSGSITVTFAVPNVADAATCSNLRSLHYENGAWRTDTNATPIYDTGTQICTVEQTVTSLSPFAVARILGTTAAAVNVGGRAMTTNGRGIANVRITMTDANGNSRTTNTSAFGYYRFTDVAAGATYIISASGKRFTFDHSSQVINLNADNNDVNFVGYANIISPQGIKSEN